MKFALTLCSFLVLTNNSQRNGPGSRNRQQDFFSKIVDVILRLNGSLKLSYNLKYMIILQCMVMDQ